MSEENKNVISWLDSNTWKDSDGDWHVKPIRFTATTVQILCPYCNRIHTHGNAYSGHRSAHCPMPFRYEVARKGYYLEFKGRMEK